MNDKKMINRNFREKLLEVNKIENKALFNSFSGETFKRNVNNFLINKSKPKF